MPELHKTKTVARFAITVLVIFLFSQSRTSYAAKPLTNSPPKVETISPSSGIFFVNTPVSYTAIYSDPNGWQNIASAQLLINISTSGQNSFYGYYDQNTNKFYLRSNDDKKWLGGFSPGSPDIIENSYVKLDCSKCSVFGNANTLVVNWSVIFKLNFRGIKNLYLYVSDDNNSHQGWICRGTCRILVDLEPPKGTIAINQNSEYTNSTAVTLSLWALDRNNSISSGLDQMQFSNDNVTWSTPESYATAKAWTLNPGDEKKTVYVKYSDKAGNWSTVYSDAIVLDTLAPGSPRGLSATAGNSFVNLSWNTNSEADFNHYNVYRSTDNSQYVKINTAILVGTSYQDTGLTNGTTFGGLFPRAPRA